MPTKQSRKYANICKYILDTWDLPPQYNEMRLYFYQQQEKFLGKKE